MRRLFAVDPAAAALGLWVGQPAADAAALVPELTLEEADPTGDHAALEALCDWAARFSPAVAADPPEGLILDVTGLDRLWACEHDLARDLETRLARQGVPVRIGVAATVGAAWALARFTAAPERPARLASGEEAEALQDLPLAALRLAPEEVAQFGRLGLDRIGHLLSLPRAALVRRFGPKASLRLDQALGRMPEALVFRRPRAPHLARLALAEPISTPQDLARVTRDLCAQLCRRLDEAGLGARRFRLELHGVDRRPRVREVSLALAARDPDGLMRLLGPKLETVDPGFGIEVATLEAQETAPDRSRQRDLGPSLDPGCDPARTAVQDPETLAPLVDRLVHRPGVEKVWRAAPNPSHLPERACRVLPPLAPPGEDMGERGGEHGGEHGGWDIARPRPVRLFARPEPVEAVALAPDDPPRLFRWRGVLHRVRLAEGPERLAPEWWRWSWDAAESAPERDYYRVEDETGARFWLFRAGTHAAGAPARWWLHGLF